MLAHGLLEEARLVYANRDAYHTAAQAIGYKEFFPYFEGKEPLEVCTAALKQASRNYAKRQLTWFRRERDVIWLDKGRFLQDEGRILQEMLRCLKEKQITA